MNDNEENKIVYGITKDNLWAHIQLEKLVKGLKYGSIVVNLRVHEDVITDLVIQENKRFRKPEEAKT